MTLEDPSTSATFWGVVSLIILQAGKMGREWMRNREVIKELAAIRAIAQRAADNAESANRKLWREAHPGQETPDPQTSHGAPIPRGRLMR